MYFVGCQSGKTFVRPLRSADHTRGTKPVVSKIGPRGGLSHLKLVANQSNRQGEGEFMRPCMAITPCVCMVHRSLEPFCAVLNVK